MLCFLCEFSFLQFRPLNSSVHSAVPATAYNTYAQLLSLISHSLSRGPTLRRWTHSSMYTERHSQGPSQGHRKLTLLHSLTHILTRMCILLHLQPSTHRTTVNPPIITTRSWKLSGEKKWDKKKEEITPKIIVLWLLKNKRECSELSKCFFWVALKNDTDTIFFLSICVVLYWMMRRVMRRCWCFSHLLSKLK